MRNGTYSCTYNNKSYELTYFIRPGIDRVLLCLHGGACSSNDFLEATRQKKLRSYTIVGFDFPGSGSSTYFDNDPLTIDDLVEIIRMFIQSLGLENITFIGHSMGGLVALKYIVKYGEIDGFISVEGNMAPQNCVFSRQVAADKTYTEFKNITWPALKKNLKGSSNKGFQTWANTLENVSPKAFFDYCPWIVRYADDPNTIREYLNLKIPHLYIYGSENKENLTFLHKLKTSGCKLAEILHCNHFPFYDNLDEFYDAAAKFLITM